MQLDLNHHDIYWSTVDAKLSVGIETFDGDSINILIRSWNRSVRFSKRKPTAYACSTRTSPYWTKNLLPHDAASITNPKLATTDRYPLTGAHRHAMQCTFFRKVYSQTERLHLSSGIPPDPKSCEGNRIDVVIPVGTSQIKAFSSLTTLHGSLSLLRIVSSNIIHRATWWKTGFWEYSKETK